MKISDNTRELIRCSLTIIFLLALATGVTWFLWQLTTVDPNMAFPLILVFGVIDLIIFLTLTSHVLNHLGLSSKEEALGLPKGSVRALIALSLIVIFAIMAVYMQMQLSDSPLKDAQGNILRYDNGTVIFYKPSEDKKDFALQTLTTVSTLVVAVAGFYFGTRSVQVAQGKAETPIILTNPSGSAKLKKDETLIITVATSPENEKVDCEIGDSKKGTVIIENNEFKFTPKDCKAGDIIKLTFTLAKDANVKKDLEITII